MDTPEEMEKEVMKCIFLKTGCVALQIHFNDNNKGEKDYHANLINLVAKRFNLTIDAQPIKTFGVKLENNPTNPNFPRTGSFISDKQKDSIEDDKYNCENADDDQKTSSKRFQLHRTINFTSFITVNHHNSQRFQEIVHHICFSPMIMEELEIS